MPVDLARFRRDRAALRSANALVGPDAAGTLPPNLRSLSTEQHDDVVVTPTSEHVVVFDYTTLDNDVAADARETALRIKGRFKSFYLDTGKDLFAIKGRLEHGQFNRWLVAEFQMTIRTAENY